MAREAGRLRMSLQAAGEAPPQNCLPALSAGVSGGFGRGNSRALRLQEFGVTECYYGHLHGKSIRFAVQGDVEGIRYRLISADGLQFCPYKLDGIG